MMGFGGENVRLRDARWIFFFFEKFDEVDGHRRIQKDRVKCL